RGEPGGARRPRCGDGAGLILGTSCRAWDYRCQDQEIFGGVTVTNPAAHNPTLHEWLAEVTAALELGDVDAPVDALLDVSRDVAHGVTRPAVPVTMFLLGYAAGRRDTTADVQTEV